MGMSNAERQRKFRQRRDADENRRREFLLKSRQKYLTEKAAGKRKSVKDMTEREKRHQRKVWRTQKRKDKERRKNALLTPPASPQGREEPQPSGSRQRRQESKSYHRQRAKCYRDLKARESEINILRKRVELYKKRWLRERGQHPIDSPRTKTRNILRNVSRKFSDKMFAKIKQNLFVNNVVIDQIRQKYKEERKSNKRKFASFFSGSILQKYGVYSMCKAALGISLSRRKAKGKTCLSIRLRKKVTAFYLRDDNSRLVTGIKSTKTLNKVKRQKRILLDTRKNLHVKFLAESQNVKMSYALFCRLRPFWVVCPVESDRQTCLCKICDNIQLQLDELSKVTSLPRCADELIKERVCSPLNKQCMFRSCMDCKVKSGSVSLSKDKCESISWQQWQCKKERRTIISEKVPKQKDVSFTIKETCTGTIAELLSQFEQNLSKYMAHIYNLRSQFRYFKQRREHLLQNECIIHIDFSENYRCKLGEEVQSMHFGASKKQVTLHTGVYYIQGHKGQTFCTVSDSLQHGPAAIWCHLRHVLKYIKQRYANIDTIEFFSDGPFAQYRQKGNFYMLTKLPLQYGFRETRWSFFETGHGKGIPDAVGGSLKREADRRVKYGHDINCAKDFVENVKDGKTKLWVVNSKDIEREQEEMDKASLKPIPGTLRIHQILVDNQHNSAVYYRDLSCLCSEDCEHFITKKAYLTDKKTDSVGPDTEIQAERNTKTQNLKRTKEESAECTEKKRRKGHIGSTVQEVDFKKYLQQLNNCASFSQLQNESEKISRQISAVDVNVQTHHNSFAGLEIDESAINYLPADLPEDNLLPCKVHANGNCLPSSASVLAYGETNRVDEMRVRIILEQVQNEKYYLNDDFLQTGKYGRNTFTKKSLKKQYCQYSDSYFPGSCLTNQAIKSTYRNEVLSITENRSYMGIWQIHALSSVLKVPIYSTYPNLGNKEVRKDLNKLIKPVHETKSEPVFILWNSNRGDMRLEHWIPNHFVPLLKVQDTAFSVESENTDETTCEETEIELDSDVKANAGNNETSHEAEAEECITIYIHDMTSGVDIGEENNSSDELHLEKIDGTENEYIFRKSTRKNECADKNETLDEEESNDEKVDTSTKKCKFTYLIKENTKECFKSNDANCDGFECAKKGTAVEVDVDQGTKNEKNADDIRLKTGDVIECKETSHTSSETKFDDIEGPKTDCKSDETYSKYIRDENNNDSYGSSVVTNDYGKSKPEDVVVDQSVKDKLSNNATCGNEQLDNSASDSGGYRTDSGSSERKENIQAPENITDNLQVGNYVIVDFNGKPFVGLVKEIGLPSVLVDCMRRSGKANENCFSWLKNTKDVSWFQLNDVVALINGDLIPEKKNKYKLDNKSWMTYLSLC